MQSRPRPHGCGSLLTGKDWCSVLVRVFPSPKLLLADDVLCPRTEAARLRHVPPPPRGAMGFNGSEGTQGVKAAIENPGGAAAGPPQPCGPWYGGPGRGSLASSRLPARRRLIVARWYRPPRSGCGCPGGQGCRARRRPPRGGSVVGRPLRRPGSSPGGGPVWGPPPGILGDRTSGIGGKAANPPPPAWGGGRCSVVPVG
jgi:hypothetical protein